MPVYEYHCDNCGHFDKILPMSRAHEKTTCPECQKAADRSITATYLGSASRNMIKAAGRNELAQNEPKHSSQLTSKHPSGCSCCSGSSRLSNQTRKNAAGDKMFPTKRPWMISH